MRMLITGGAGFIGSHLCEKYTKDGHSVICLDNFLSGDVANVKPLLDYRNFKLIEGDIRDAVLLKKTVRDIDVVFHLAAQVHVDMSYAEPKLTYDINVMGTQNVLEIARSRDVKKVIHTSTSEVYGSAQYIPIDEKHPLDAPHPYGASKIAADRMCNAYVKTYGMNISIRRFFNVFGPRQRDSGYGAVIPMFTKRVLSKMQPIVYGKGMQTRDYTYIEDIVRAFDLILNHKPSLEPVNIGYGKDVSILDLANMVIRLCGKEGKIKPIHDKPRIGEVNKLVADTRKAKRILGWKPEYDFETGLRMFIKWYKKEKFGRKSAEPTHEN
jgi:UDP-glucose 4-epimerase